MSPRPRQRRAVFLLAGALALLLLALGVWINREVPAPSSPTTAIPVAADSVDAENEGRLVKVTGRLSVEQPATDPQLGLRAADAIVLIREVEMLQWQEHCSAGTCTLATTWSPTLIDSTRFSASAGQRNPDRFPLQGERFAGKGIHLGAFVPDVDLLLASLDSTPRPVSLDEFPENLAASFNAVDGALVSGNDREHPAVGDLRIRYRIVPAAQVTLSGIQQSSRLLDPARIQQP